MLTNRTCNQVIHNNVATILECCEEYGTPFYLYSESLLISNCQALKKMPQEYGLLVRYAMKANSSKSLLKVINSQGIQIDASSFNEVRRAVLCGVALDEIMYTSQEVLKGGDFKELQTLLLKGLKYNVCSMRQLGRIVDFCAANNICLSMRVHPNEGSGESATRNTGDKYSCFGIALSDVDEALRIMKGKGVKLTGIHVHIGSGGDPKKWRKNIDREMGFLKKYDFRDVKCVNFGVPRMPDEDEADIQKLGEYARKKVVEFYKETGRKLTVEVEPGTFLIANSGFLVCGVLDKKKTDAFNFLILDGGMECNTRPVLYGSRHPFYVISRDSKSVISDDLNTTQEKKAKFVVVGKCCESGDSQSIDDHGHIYAREMNEPDVDDVFVIGGAGAYCSSMSPFNYNSHLQAAEVLITKDGKARLIRKRQTIEDIMKNEI